MDEELVDAGEGPVFVRGRIRRGAGAPAAGGEVFVLSAHRAAQYARTMSGDQRGQIRPSGQTGGIDPRDAAFFVRDDYYDVLAKLRAEDPVHECAPGFWAVSRYEDIRNLSRDPGRFCSGRGALVNDPMRTSDGRVQSRSILHMDPPEHAAFRGLVNRRFTPRAMSGLAESIRKSASTLLGAVETRDEIDFVAELAAPYPLIVIAELLGIDESDREDFRGWSDAAIESPDLPPDQTVAALGELSGFIMEHIRSKREPAGRGSGLAAGRERSRRMPAEQGGAVHVPPDAVGGRKRDHPHPLVGGGPGPGRAPGPARRPRVRAVAGARRSGGVSALGDARPCLLPHGDRGRRGGGHPHQ